MWLNRRIPVITLACLTLVVIAACDNGGGLGIVTISSPAPGPLPPNPPSGPAGTYISGKVLDTNSFAANGTEMPVVGVRVSFLGESTVVVTDAAGEFVIDNLQAGQKVIDFDTTTANAAPTGDTYAGFREQIVIADGANEITRPFYLPRIASNSLTTIDPNVDTVVTNPDIGVSLTVLAGTAKDGNGNLFTGQLSISEVPDALAPAALPVDLEPGLLFTIQPVGVRFDLPATLSIRNDRDAWPAGSKINFWSLDPDLGVFAIVGDGVVVADGSTIETMSGGVMAADWHAPLPPAVKKGTTPRDNDGNCQGDKCCDRCKKDVGSEVDISNGRFRETIELTGYVSQTRLRRLEFVYSSDRAYPFEIMAVAPIVEATTPVPNQVSYQGFLNGEDQGYDIFLDTSALQANQDEAFRIALALDGTGLTTNSYVGQARLSSHYDLTTVSGRFFENYMIVNDAQSEFGAGWRLLDHDRIYPATSGGVVLVDGSGYPLRFVEPSGSGSIVTIIADAPTFNDVPVMQGLLDEMGIPVQLRSVFANANEPQISMDDIADTSLFIWMVGNTFPYFGFAADTVEERSNTLTVLEAAVAQGVPLLMPHIDPSPRDTGFFINPACCVRDPETGQQENLTGLRRSSNWEPVQAPLGSQRLLQLQDPSHPIFNGPFGTIAADPASPVANGVGTAFNFSQSIVRPQRLNASEVPLVRAYQDNGTTTALTNEYPIVVTEHAPFATPSLTIGIGIGNTAPVDPFIETLIKNSITWLLSGNVTEPGQLVSPAGDYSVLTKLEDGTFTRRTKFGELYTFDASGLLQTIADRNGNTTSYVYDSASRLSSVTDPVGKAIQLSYLNGKLSTVTEPSGRVTHFSHDANGNLVTVTFPDNTSRTYTYDSRHLMTSQTDELGFVNSYQFNSVGQFVQGTQADGSIRMLIPAQSIGLVEASGNSRSNPAKAIRLADQQ